MIALPGFFMFANFHDTLGEGLPRHSTFRIHFPFDTKVRNSIILGAHRSGNFPVADVCFNLSSFALAPRATVMCSLNIQSSKASLTSSYDWCQSLLASLYREIPLRAVILILVVGSLDHLFFTKRNDPHAFALFTLFCNYEF